MPKRSIKRPPEIRGHAPAPAARAPYAALAAALFGVAAVVAAVHWPVLSATAIAFDDDMYLHENVLVRNPSWSSAGRFLGEVLAPSTVGGYYQPLAMISLMLDSAAGGSPENLRPFHATSLALHVLNSMLVAALLYALFGHLWIAAGLALLFGLHPMTVEPIAWVAERKTPLATSFALASLLVYVWYARRGGAWRLAISLGLFVLALMSKPTTTPLPLLLPLLDYWPLRRLSRRALLEKLPFFAAALISAVITYVSQAQTSIAVGPGRQGLSRIVLTLAHNVIYYPYKIVVPVGLSPHTPYPEPFSPAHPMVLAGLIGTPLLVALLLWWWRWTPAAVVGWLFFLVAILPTLGIVGFTNVIASDKYAYLPMVGLLMALAAAWVWVARPPSAGEGAGRYVAGGAGREGCAGVGRSVGGSAGGYVAAGFVVMAAGLLAFQTRRQIEQWRTTEALGEHMVMLAPRAPEARIHYGVALAGAGKMSEAMGQFQQVLDAAPDHPRANYSIAVILAQQGQRPAAEQHYRTALAGAQKLTFYPETHKIHNNLAAVLIQQGRYDEAAAHLQEALRLRPEFADARNNFGLLAGLRGGGSGAAAASADAVRADPLNYKARVNLALALLREGKTGDAAAEIDQALAIKPDYAPARLALGRIRVKQSRPAEALAEFREAVRLDADLADARVSLAALLAAEGKLDEARDQYLAALRIEPGRTATHNDLAVLYTRLKRPEDALRHFAEALRLEPRFVAARHNRAMVLVDLGRAAEAIADYRAILEADPRSLAGRVNLANALRAAGKPDEAVVEYHKAIEQEPNSAGIHYNLGLALEDLRRVDEAASAYRAALRLDPNAAGPRERLQALGKSTSP